MSPDSVCAITQARPQTRLHKMIIFQLQFPLDCNYEIFTLYAQLNTMHM